MTSAERLRAYAELAVRVGANVQPGQDVVVTCLVEHAEIARAVTREAYRAGAQHVVVLYSDLHVRRAAIEYGPESEIGWSAPYLLDWYRRWPTENPAVISLTGNPTPELMKDLDPTLVGRADPRDIRAAVLESIGGRHINWTIVAAPNAGWATQVFGEPDVERLWDAVGTATRLDDPDPVAAWRAHTDALQARADGLNERRFDAIRFRGPGTDLTVGLVPGALWRCAAFETANGIRHVPNLPTEEVFTSPDWRRAEGHVRSTYPLVTSGTKVTGLEFRLESGKIVDVQAESGAEILRAQLAVDEQAPYLGEVALVDGSSAVKQTGLVFSDTLSTRTPRATSPSGPESRRSWNRYRGTSSSKLASTSPRSTRTSWWVARTSRWTASIPTGGRRRSSAATSGSSRDASSTPVSGSTVPIAGAAAP